MLGNTGDGNDMHPTIGESTSPILTATVLPATNNEEKTKMDQKYRQNTSNYLPELGPVSGKLRSVNRFFPNDNGPCLPIMSPTGHANWLVDEQDGRVE